MEPSTVQAESAWRARMREKTSLASPQSAGMLSSAPGITSKTPSVRFPPMDLLNNWQQEMLGCFSSFLPPAWVLFHFSVLEQGFQTGLSFTFQGGYSQPTNPNKIHICGRSSLEGYFDSEMPFGSWAYVWPCSPSEKKHGVGVKTLRMVIPYAQTFRKQGLPKGDALEYL